MLAIHFTFHDLLVIDFTLLFIGLLGVLFGKRVFSDLWPGFLILVTAEWVVLVLAVGEVAYGMRYLIPISFVLAMGLAVVFERAEKNSFVFAIAIFCLS